MVEPDGGEADARRPRRRAGGGRGAGRRCGLRARHGRPPRHPGHARRGGDRRPQEIAPVLAWLAHAAKCILIADADSGGFMLRAPLAVLALAAVAAPSLAFAADPPATASGRPRWPGRSPTRSPIHGDTLVDDYYWMRNKGTPEVEAHLNAELAYAEAFMKPTAALQQKLYDEMLVAHPADRHQRALPRARLLLLLAHGGGEAVPDLRRARRDRWRRRRR